MAADYVVKRLSSPDMTSAQFLAVLRAANSPVSDAEAEAVFAYCAARRVSGLWLLSVFNHESSMGKAGTATKTHSWGNTREPSFGAPSIGVVAGRSGSFSAYPDWAFGGVSTVARVCDHKPYANANTVREITRIWAPDFDGNDSQKYADAVLSDIARWASPAPPGGATMAVPKPHIVSRPSPNRNGYSGTRRVDAVVWHVTAGGFAGSLSWLCNPDSGASSNYLLDKDGTVCELVPPTEDAWTNGAVNQPDTSNPLIGKWQSEGANPNQRTVSIEIVRETSANNQPGGFTLAQHESLIKLTAWLCQQFKLTPDRTHIFGHRTIDSVNRPYCPGLAEGEWRELVGRVAALVGGNVPPPAPAADPGFPGLLQPNGSTKIGAVDFGGQAVSVEEVAIHVRNAEGRRYRRVWRAHALGPWEKVG